MSGPSLPWMRRASPVAQGGQCGVDASDQVFERHRPKPSAGALVPAVEAGVAVVAEEKILAGGNHDLDRIVAGSVADVEDRMDRAPGKCSSRWEDTNARAV